VRNSRLPKLRYMILPLIVIVAVAPGLARAQEWAQVKGGTFEVAPAILSSVKRPCKATSLRSDVSPPIEGRFFCNIDPCMFKAKKHMKSTVHVTLTTRISRYLLSSAMSL
jgi:hypothetical protein